MSKFGLPMRTATSDANEGIINPPSKQTTPLQVSTTTDSHRVTELDKGIQSFGEALGGAIAKRATEEREAIVEQRRVEARARQGQNTAINTIDKSKKNVGWERFVFGEDVEYRAAQQQAVSNLIQSEYNSQLANIDSYAGESPSEYNKRLSGVLKGITEKYKGDKETQTLATNVWLDNVEKLTNQQYRAHHAYTQMQSRAEYDNSIQLVIDELTILGTKVSNEDDAKSIIDKSNALFSGVNRPEKVTPEVERELLVSRVAHNLKEGNIGAYNAAKASGWLETLNPADHAKIKAGEKVYFGKLKLEASTMVEEANIQASEATKLIEVDAIYRLLEKNLEDLEHRKPTTVFSKEGILQERSEAVANEYTYKNRIRKAEEKARKKAAKAEAKAEELDSIKAKILAQIGSDPVTNDPDMYISPTDAREGMDSIIVDKGKALFGEEASTRDIAAAILTNDKFNLLAVNTWGGHDADSQIVNTAVETFVNSDLSAWTTDKGTLSEDAVDIIARLDRFRARRPDKFNAMLGDNKLVYDRLKKGIEAGHTQKRIMDDVARIRDKSDTKLPFKKVVVDGRAYDKTEYIQHILQQHLTPQGGATVNPTAQDMNDFAEVFQAGLDANYQDPKAAREHLEDQLRNGQSKLTIGNKTHLVNKVEGFTYETNDILRWADNKNRFSGQIQSQVGTSHSIDEKPITKLSELPNLQVYTVTGYDGIFFKTPKAINPIMIQFETLRTYDQEMETLKKEQLSIAAKNKLAEDTRARELMKQKREKPRLRGMRQY